MLCCDVVDVAGIQRPAPPPNGASTQFAVLCQLHPGLVNEEMEAADSRGVSGGVHGACTVGRVIRPCIVPNISMEETLIEAFIICICEKGK